MRNKIYIYIFYMFCCFSLYSDSPLYVKCIIEKKYERYWQISFKKLLLELKKHNIYQRNHRPDVIFCNRVTDEILNYNLPIILLARRSPATLAWQKWGDLEHHLVKAIFKNTVFKEKKKLTNAPQICGRYHFYLLQKLANFNHIPIFNKKHSKSVLDKIYCVPWHWRCSCFSNKFESYKKIKLNLDKKRPIDVFFVGSTFDSPVGSDQKIYSWHRKKAVDAIKNLKNVSKFIITGKKPLAHEEYMHKIRQSKIVVSPWGWSEWCYRDCEAMVSGAVLIKPDSAFVKTMPDLYRNNVTYVPCKPDFSDLEEKVRYVLDHYDEYKSMRIQAKKLMEEKTRLKSLARYFAKCLRKALKN